PLARRHGIALTDRPGQPSRQSAILPDHQPGHLGHGAWSLSANPGGSPRLLCRGPALLRLHAPRRPRLFGSALRPACAAVPHCFSCGARTGARPLETLHETSPMKFAAIIEYTQDKAKILEIRPIHRQYLT